MAYYLEIERNMNLDTEYLNQLLHTWEETYKKGQLTLWLLLALRDSPKYMGDVREFIQVNTSGIITCEEQSVYRALRKFYDLEIVDFEMRDGKSGPSRKYYFLTELGQKLLRTFINRNIKIMYTNEISHIF